MHDNITLVAIDRKICRLHILLEAEDEAMNTLLLLHLFFICSMHMKLEEEEDAVRSLHSCACKKPFLIPEETAINHNFRNLRNKCKQIKAHKKKGYEFKPRWKAIFHKTYQSNHW